MKKTVIALGAFFGVFVIAAMAIPVIVDVDKYRSRIVEIAESSLDAKIELGKLGLSLWGQVRVNVDGIKINDAKGDSLLSVKSGFFHLPLLSIVSGSPRLTLKLDSPSVKLVKESDGKWNWIKIIKAQSHAGEKSSPGATQALPALVLGARFGLEMRNATLDYKDLVSRLNTQVSNLSFIVRDLSLTSKMEVELGAELNTEMKGAKNEEIASLTGPLELFMTATPTFSEGSLRRLQGSFEVKADSLKIVAAGQFQKGKGTELSMKGGFDFRPEKTQLENWMLTFSKAKIETTGEIETSGGGKPLQLDLKVKTSEIQMEDLASAIPRLSDLNSKGSLLLDLKVKGPSSALRPEGILSIKDLSAKPPGFDAPLVLAGDLNFSDDQIKKILLSLKGAGTELKVTGDVASVSKLRFDLNMSANAVDADQLSALAAGGAATAKASASEKSDMANPDDALVALRSSPALANASGTLSWNFGKIVTKDVTVNGLKGKLTLKELKLAMTGLELGVFDGKIKGSFSADLNAKSPTYVFNTDVEKLDLRAAVKSKFELFKDTVLGKADFSISGNGASFFAPLAKKNLKARGKLLVQPAKMASVDVGKMVKESVSGIMDKIGDKVPPLKGKKLGNLPDKESEFEFIKSSFSIADGKFEAPDFEAKSKKDQGVDIKGKTNLNLLDESLAGRWEIIDTYNVTKLHDISVDQGGVKLDHVLAEPGQPVKFIVTVGCKTSKPCVNSADAAGALAAVAVKNLSKGVASKAKEEAQKRVTEVLKEQGGAKVKDLLKGLGGGIFGN